MLTTRESFSLSLSLNLDVLDAGYVAENDESVQADVKAFLLEACKRAACVGLPCRMVAGND